VRARFSERWIAPISTRIPGMKFPSPPKNALSQAAAWIVLILVILMLLPVPFGGRVSYVIVNGTSMEPSFHKGDLVMLRNSARYKIGDIVTYKHPGIGAVFHRIIDREGERFILKGDNNTWVDSYRPVREEIGGLFWMQMPGAGKWLSQIKAPWAMSILAGLIFMIAGLGWVDRTGVRRERKCVKE